MAIRDITVQDGLCGFRPPGANLRNRRAPAGAGGDGGVNVAMLVEEAGDGEVVVGAVDGFSEEGGYGEDGDFRVAFLRGERDGVGDDDLADLGARGESLDGVAGEDSVGAGDV